MTDEGKLRADIATAWAALTEKSFIKRTVATLEDRLEEGETVSHLASASHGNQTGTGALVLTGRRLFFYRRARSGVDYFDIPWESGSVVSWTASWLTGKLAVTTGGSRWEFTGLSKTDGGRFADALRGHTFTEPTAAAPTWYAAGPPDYPAPESEASPAPSSEETIVAALERLGALYERGILDEAEFARAKASLLARLSGDARPD